MNTTDGDTLISVLLETGMADQQELLGVLAKACGGETWLAAHLVAAGVVGPDDMGTAQYLIHRLRNGTPREVQQARAEMLRLQMAHLDSIHADHARASTALLEQSKRISDEYLCLKKS